MGSDPFDGWVADEYATLWSHLYDPVVLDPAVDFLAECADGGPVLELGIGTGRLAIPLRRRGIDVCGIERAPAMLEVLRRDPDGAAIEVVVGDMSTTELGRDFTLVYLARNTIMNLITQDDQVACFRNAAAHLRPGGRFVVEVVVPPWRRLPPGQTSLCFDHTPTHVGIDEIDPATQQSFSHHVFTTDGTTRRFSAPFRYVWPAELDLMARLAGLDRSERWSDWRRNAFSADSVEHVSVWRTAD
ncbi:MAG: class I SAM-dependent DNA methyltransferase [Acidimicrobiia bacterium]